MTYGKKVEVNGTHLNGYVEGNGPHTIVFMAGSGVTSPVLEYKSLYEKMTDENTIAVIEKAGYGLSESMTTARTVENLVEETRKVLDLLGLKPPYILAPHSYSGIEAIWWANNYPGEVDAILGIDMVVPAYAFAQAKEIPQDKKITMLDKQRKLLARIARQGILSKIVKNQTVNASGLISGNVLSDEEKELYIDLFYKNIQNSEIYEEAVLATENAVKADSKGNVSCPLCLYISSMKSPLKELTWQDAGIAYAKECKGEYHLTKENHMLYTHIPDKMANTFKEFINRRLL